MPVTLEETPVAGSKNRQLIPKLPPQQEACFEVYNDWIMDYCSVNPDRLVGIPCISLYDVNRGIKEMERCVKELKMPGLEIGSNIDGKNLSDESFERFQEELYAAGAGKDGLVIDVRENGGGSTADVPDQDRRVRPRRSISTRVARSRT